MKVGAILVCGFCISVNCVAQDASTSWNVVQDKLQQPFTLKYSVVVKNRLPKDIFETKLKATLDQARAEQRNAGHEEASTDYFIKQIEAALRRTERELSITFASDGKRFYYEQKTTKEGDWRKDPDALTIYSNGIYTFVARLKSLNIKPGLTYEDVENFPLLGVEILGTAMATSVGDPTQYKSAQIPMTPEACNVFIRRNQPNGFANYVPGYCDAMKVEDTQRLGKLFAWAKETPIYTISFDDYVRHGSTVLARHGVKQDFYCPPNDTKPSDIVETETKVTFESLNQAFPSVRAEDVARMMRKGDGVMIHDESHKAVEFSLHDPELMKYFAEPKQGYAKAALAGTGTIIVLASALAFRSLRGRSKGSHKID